MVVIVCIWLIYHIVAGIVSNTRRNVIATTIANFSRSRRVFVHAADVNLKTMLGFEGLGTVITDEVLLNVLIFGVDGVGVPLVDVVYCCC